MGVQPPFLYDQPTRNSFSGPEEKPFNPRAATVASWTPPPPRARPVGPLINLNRHPDSYVVVPNGQDNVKPMRPSTKSWIKRLRRFQLILRVAQLLGASGLLFCVVVIRGTSTSFGWIIRVAPAVELLHTIYAIHHLCRNATRMTPASSASYMWFSSILDCGLSAFLAFTAILCQVEYTSGQYDWTTLLGTEVAKHDIIFAGFIISTSLGGLHLISLVIAIWLAIIFRKIARLPPDMNPLEDNLTARSHKRNKSEFTIEDKNMSQTSLTSSRGHGRSDSVDPLISPPRTVPFMHTRTGSSENVAMYRPNTGMHGRNGSSEDVSTYHQDNGSRHSPVGGIATNQPYQSSNASFQGSRTGLDHNAGGFYNQPSHVRTSRPDFNRPPSSGPSPNRPGSAQNRGIQHRPAKPSQLRADWTHPSSTPYSTTNDENVEPSWAQQEQTSYQPYHEAVDIRDWYSPSPGQKGRAQANKDYLPVPSHEPEKRKSKLYDFDRDVKTPVPQAQSPLGMHPPSPSVYSSSPNPSPPPPEHRRVALSDADVNLPDAMSTQRVANASPPRSGPQRPSSFVGSGTKTKYYGDVIHFSRVPKLSRDKSDLSGYSDRSEVDGGTDSASAYSTSEQGIPDANLDKKGRVISNSGYDLNSTYAGLDPEFGKGMASRRRDVSGKIAEEGRGNGSNNTGAPGAAGWARFKGL